jgi:uncharacterized protein (DUF58 family)
VLAARLAALLGWAAIGNGDRLGAFLFGSGEHKEIPPKGGRRAALELIRNLVTWSNESSGSKTYDWTEALQRLHRVIRPGSLIFLLSDFYQIDDNSELQLSRLRQHNDIVACHFVDVLELKPPPPGRYGITDGYSIRTLDTRVRHVRDHYQSYFTQHHQKIHTLMRRRAIPIITMATNDNIVESLRRGLQS